MLIRATWGALFFALLCAQERVIRVDTQLVQVNIVVHDKDGNPVDNLSREDFTVYDNGKPQDIRSFSIERLNSPPSAPAKLPANTFGNDPAWQGSRPTGVTVVLLDGSNTKLADLANARQQLLKFVAGLNPQDKVALYALGSTLRVLQDFTGDADQLTRFLETHRVITSGELAGEAMKGGKTGVKLVDDMIEAMDAGAKDNLQIIRTQRTYDALAAIADHVAHIPGRKNLVWISASFPLTLGLDDPSLDSRGYRDPRRGFETFRDERERATRALVKANVAIYPVDARGLAGNAVSMSSEVSSSGRVRGSLPTVQVKTSSEYDTMNALASATGGRVFRDSNEIGEAVRSALHDSAITYTIGFYPDVKRLDGKFHELSVKLKRKGLNARFRRGYVAYPDSPSANQRELTLLTALWSPLESTGITLTSRAQRAKNGESATFQLAVVADPRQIQITSDRDRWTGKIEVVFAQLDAEGKTQDMKRDTVNMHLEQAVYDDIMKAGLVLTRNLIVVDRVTQIRVVVFDHRTGALGSLIIPVSNIQ